MEKYNYEEAMVNDIKEWILMNGILTQAKQEEWTKDELYDWLFDELWANDCITGNGCYGYASEEKCEEYVAHNLSLYFEAAAELDDWPQNRSQWVYSNPAQHMDTTIRCYLLGASIDEAIDELNYEVN